MFGIYPIALVLGVVTSGLLGIPLIGSYSIRNFLYQRPSKEALIYSALL